MFDQSSLSASAAPVPESREAKLLFQLASIGRAEFFARNQSVCQLTAGIDWDGFFAMADKHRLLPLAFHAFRVAPAGTVPDRVLKALWTRYASNLQRNRRMTLELDGLLRTLRASGIHGVALKGPALTGMIFADIGLREFSDLDVLVCRNDLPAAKQILIKSGYSPAYALRAEAETAYLKAGRQYDIVLYSEASETTVELHWRTSTDAAVERLDDPTWRQHLVRVQVEGVWLSTFSPAELLLYLCIHGAKHCWERLAWLVDVAELVTTHPDLDWQWIGERAGQLGARKRLAIGLALAVELLALRLPEGILQDEIWASPLKKPLATLRQRLSHVDLPDGNAEGDLLLRLSLYDSWWQKLRQALLLVFTPNSADWSELGSTGPSRMIGRASKLSRLLRHRIDSSIRGR